MPTPYQIIVAHRNSVTDSNYTTHKNYTDSKTLIKSILNRISAVCRIYLIWLIDLCRYKYNKQIYFVCMKHKYLN